MLSLWAQKRKAPRKPFLVFWVQNYAVFMGSFLYPIFTL